MSYSITTCNFNWKYKMTDTDVLPFKAEYAKSKRSLCNACKKNIGKNSLRIAAMLSSWYVDDAKVAKWYHYSCFFRKKNISNEGDIDGFNSLRPEDQEKIRNRIDPTTQSQGYSKTSTSSAQAHEIPSEGSSNSAINKEDTGKRKSKDIDTDIANKRGKSDENMAKIIKLREQTVGLWSIYDNLRKECNNQMLKDLLIYNNQKLVADTRGFHLVVDGMAFGALNPCKECSGILFFSRVDHGYRCLRCHSLTQNPSRTQWKIPDELCEKSKYLREYRSVVRERVFMSTSPANSDEIQSGRTTENKTISNESVAVDYRSGLLDTHHVIKEPDGSVYSVNLENGYRHHSYCKIQALQSNTTNLCCIFHAWGDVNSKKGETSVETGYSKEEAMLIFDQMYFEKTGNGFGKEKKFVKMARKFYPVYLDVEKDEEGRQVDLIFTDKGSKVFRHIRNLLKLIFDVQAMKNTLLEFRVDLKAIKLADLSENQINDASQCLSMLQNLISKRKNKKEILEQVNRFYAVIPHNFGIDDPETINNLYELEDKEFMLDDLMDIITSYDIIRRANSDGQNPMDTLYKSLKTEITYLYSNSEEFGMVKNYAENSHLSIHNYFWLTVEEVFKVERYGEDKQYQHFSNFNNRMLLWYQTRFTSYASMLSKGIRFTPPKTCLDRSYIYGKGVYFTDSASMCAERCEPTMTNPTIIMCLCEVALGKIYEMRFPDCHEMPKMPATANSFKCPGEFIPNPSEKFTLENGTVVPLGKMTKDNNGSGANDYVVYDTRQLQIRYLVKAKVNFRNDLFH
ncbi:Poly [ADP-ribose] polymerase 1 [Trichoplax sp. H2]|nr:Poly [ADP-ribose] polymerase 1 [Trichoplax sp. H2]|eukprot:RDD42964.1 Poly [ADP-ribose] polymerase 1 [Trichoplax sp. H2]